MRRTRARRPDLRDATAASGRRLSPVLLLRDLELEVVVAVLLARPARHPQVGVTFPVVCRFD